MSRVASHPRSLIALPAPELHGLPATDHTPRTTSSWREPPWALTEKFPAWNQTFWDHVGVARDLHASHLKRLGKSRGDLVTSPPA